MSHSLKWSLLSIVFAVATVHGQDSICGKIPSGALNIPSYRFQIVDVDLKPLNIAGLTAKGELYVTESKWGHTYNDWNWEDVSHNIEIPITYDAATGYFVSQPLKNVPLAKRKHLWPPTSNCFDRVEKLRFTFTLGNFTPTSGYEGLYNENLYGLTLSQIDLPADGTILTIKLTNWNGMKSP